MKRYVIIGGGIAAASCAEGIRSRDQRGIVTVISEEKELYYRPLISYYLEGKTSLDHMKYRDGDFYQKINADIRYGTRAVSIRKDQQEVLLSDGEVLPYDELCLATGSSPFVPAFEGLETVENKTAFMSLEDMLRLEKMVGDSSRVLIIGAGLIGLKCAEGLLRRVQSVTVCDLADRILSSILDEPCAALMQQYLERYGMQFLLGDSVKRFEKNLAYMASGKEVSFDVLVLCVGVRPNLTLFKELEGKTDRGILVDERMATSIEHIYAAGDCTQGFDLSCSKKRIMAILPNASMQGFTAGVNMTGASQALTNLIPMNAIGFFGLHALTAGSYEGTLYEEKTDHSIKRLYIQDDLLKGFMLVGVQERAGIYTSLIRDQVPLSSLNEELMKKMPTTAAYSAEIRRKKFGGAV